MKVGGCWFSPTQSEYYRCGGYGRSTVVASEYFQNGFCQEKWQWAIARRNGSLMSSVGQGQIQQKQGRFSPIGSGSDVLLTKWAPNLQTLAPRNPSSNERIRNRTLVGRPPWICGSCTCLSSFSAEEGWKKKQTNAGGRTTRRRVSGVRIRSLHRSILGLCAAVSGGKDRIVIPGKVDITARPSGGEGSIYRPFVDFAVQELSRRSDVSPLLLKEEFRNMIAQDATANIDNMAFTSSKIQMFRIASIQTGSSMQVLNVAGFARPEYDLPIFCADFFSVSNKNIIVLDLNPLYNTDDDKDYKDRYFNELIPLVNKYTELLPWGNKLTGESLQFFSPLVLWTKAGKEDQTKFLYPAFQDYLRAWLKMIDSAIQAVDATAIARNQEAQHRYMSWRVTKDPGRPLLTRLYGEQLAERYIKEFLFSGLSTLGTKSFLDYFPEYRSADGSICKQRSMMGKSFEKRPWDKDGCFSPN